MDVNPDTLKSRNKGKWVTAYIELPEDYRVGDIDLSMIKLNNKVQPESHPKEVGDHDRDGITDLMIKFDRASVISLLNVGDATLTIAGEVNGVPFEGSDRIRVLDK